MGRPLHETPTAWGPTQRWTEMRPHYQQHQLATATERFLMVPAGRRSGKTEIFKRLIVNKGRDNLLNPKPWPDPRYFLGAPVRDQAKRIWWNDLKLLIPKTWLLMPPRESDLIITLKWGTEFHVVGMDKPARIEGVSWDGGVMDEFADCRPGSFDAHIRPALADRRGFAHMIGVPDRDAPGQKEYKSRRDRALRGELSETRVITWSSRDILDPEEISQMAETMDADLFAQEMEGAFLLSGGRAFGSFVRQTHASKKLEYDPNLPLALACDFNIDPMCWGLIQFVPGRQGWIKVLHEFVMADTDTETACLHVSEWCEAQGWDLMGLKLYGDATGGARDTTSGTTDWRIIKTCFKNFKPTNHVPAGSPAIKDTLNSLRAVLKNAAGVSRIQIDPSCGQLIDDMEDLTWPSDLSAGHCAAWLRYFVEREFSIPMSFDQPIGKFNVSRR